MEPPPGNAQRTAQQSAPPPERKILVIGKNSKVFSIFDKYGTKTVKTIEDVVGLIGG